ncbi:hypothetical protein VP1G_00321 [Cytospora mali]|uniref:Rhodopsin domain-containing protein n=1 Tax=Cytospora mali TaxID=578113 RepID=A0A194UMQ3_CYTMA|nr:hypothetical protein VP1G_00321 [Valsa mali var. pyri (nom. inval.)]
MSESLAVRLDDSTAGGYDCNENIGPTGLAAIWFMVALALIVVTARVYAQARITKQFGLSDYLMICSITVTTGFAALITVQYQYGWGRHQACIGDIQEVETQLKYNITGQSFGIMGSTFGRLSFIVFMLHLFDTKTWPRWSLRVLFVLQVITNVGTYLGYAHTSFNGATDVFLTALPTAMVWNLQMPTRLKVGLAMLLGMSAVALVGLIMNVEGTLVEIAASIPLLRPLFKRRFGGLKSSNKPSSYELPHYAARSEQVDSSGISKLGRARATIRSSGMHGGGADDDSSMEDILPMRGKSDIIVRSNSILVRQEYSVNYHDAALVALEGTGMDGPAREPRELCLSTTEHQH